MQLTCSPLYGETAIPVVPTHLQNHNAMKNLDLGKKTRNIVNYILLFFEDLWDSGAELFRGSGEPGGDWTHCFGRRLPKKIGFPKNWVRKFSRIRYFLMKMNDLFLNCQIYFLIDLVWLWPEKCWLLWRNRLLLQRTNWFIGLVVWAIANGAKRPGFNPCSC